MNKTEAQELIETKLKILYQSVWERRFDEKDIREWIAQFEYEVDTSRDEQFQMLFLLSHFMYFGMREIREMLKSLYRDLYKKMVVKMIRYANNHTIDLSMISELFENELKATKFIGVGNPSESGVHLLYYFRQENNLSRTNFINTYDIFLRTRTSGNVITETVRDDDIKHYVFLDDLCGSGTQANDYLSDIVRQLKALKPSIKIYYFSLFATSKGLEAVKDLNLFDQIGCVMELDESFKCFADQSRIYVSADNMFLKDFARSICQKHGDKIYPDHPLGYKDGQLLVGFSHNTPDNTIPVFWFNAPDSQWMPIFPRYPKVYE